MRLARLATPIAVLTLAVAGCGGGSKVVVQEVPGGSRDVTVKGGDALAPKTSPTPTPTITPTPTAESDGTASSTAETPQATPESTTQQDAAPPQSTPQASAGGGAAAPEATPAPGSDAQQFETFCQQNPGAC